MCQITYQVQLNSSGILVPLSNVADKRTLPSVIDGTEVEHAIQSIDVDECTSRHRIHDCCGDGNRVNSMSVYHVISHFGNRIWHFVPSLLRSGTIGFFKRLFFANANNGECEHVHCYNINSFSFSLQHQHQMISCDSSFHSNPILYLKCIYITYHICCIVVLSVNTYNFFFEWFTDSITGAMTNV